MQHEKRQPLRLPLLPQKKRLMLGGNIMKKNCENCKQNTEIAGVTIPFFVHESEIARAERQIKRMWIALIVCIMLIFASNALWLWVWNSYDFYTEEVVIDSRDGGNANYIGQNGDIYNGENNSP